MAAGCFGTRGPDASPGTEGSAHQASAPLVPKILGDGSFSAVLAEAVLPWVEGYRPEQEPEPRCLTPYAKPAFARTINLQS